jgi:3-hydroxybutyryl-CoA dehydrogenase
MSEISIRPATPDDLGHMMALISTATSNAALADCDVVIEAVTENEELKTRIFGQLASNLGPDTILASNTSTISVTRMASATPTPPASSECTSSTPSTACNLLK